MRESIELTGEFETLKWSNANLHAPLNLGSTSFLGEDGIQELNGNRRKSHNGVLPKQKKKITCPFNWEFGGNSIAVLGGIRGKGLSF